MGDISVDRLALRFAAIAFGLWVGVVAWAVPYVTGTLDRLSLERHEAQQREIDELRRDVHFIESMLYGNE